MVQFVKDGLYIPEGLLRAHEQGRVVFFCGAGISLQAGLPGFGELVKHCYEELSTERTPKQDEAIKPEQYDQALRSLENKLGPRRLDVRRTITKRLHEHREQRELDTHRALLRLAGHQNRTRLITTNFDHLFEESARMDGYKIKHHDPSVKLLKNEDAWDGVVYLHGRVPEQPTTDGDKSNGQNFDDLVLSSKDFAQAYQIEGHVTHFIQRLLFLRYTICFVGYSLEDVMVQYLLDGNRTLPSYSIDKDTPRLYAFVGIEGTSDTSQEKWKERGVQPIEYYCKKPTGKPEDHTPLHKTLCAWAQSMDVAGKIKLIEDNACKEPSDSTPDDDFAGRVLWALKDTSGEPARRFASLTQAPSLEWLGLGKDRDTGDDMDDGWDWDRGKPMTKPDQGSDVWVQTQRPLFDSLNIDNHDDIIRPLSRWLARHLNDPRVLIWLIRQQPELRRRVTSYIQMSLRLKDDSGNLLSGLEPRAHQYWHLFLGGHVLCELCDRTEFLDWQASLAKNGLTLASKMHLLSLLKPMLQLELKLSETTLPKSHARSFNDVRCKLSYAVGHRIGAPYWLTNPRDGDNWRSAWQEALPELFPDFNRLLRDGLDLLCMVGDIDHESDRSYIARHSISDHECDNNRGRFASNTLGLYITLMRDAWLAKHKQHPEQSKADATQWMRESYPAFKRLAFFAVTQCASIQPQQALEWLLVDGGIWLWSGETRREVIRLIVYLAPKLDTTAHRTLEQAILAKPLQLNHWDIDDWDVYLRLARLEKHLPTGARLSDDAQAQLKMLREQNPKWGYDPDEDVEFPYRVSVRSIDEPGDGRTYYKTPLNRESWVRRIQEHPNIDLREEEDGWRALCDTRFPIAMCVLCALAKDDLWPVTRWRHALNAWVSSKHSKRIHRSWRRVSPLLETASDETLSLLDTSLGAWILKATKQGAIAPHDETLLIQLSERLLALPHAKRDNVVTMGRRSVPNYVSQSLNSRVGCISEALLVYWHNKQPEDNAKLPIVFESIFTRMCDIQQKSFRCARVALARYILPLFRADPEWTKKHVLPLFDWDRDPQSRSEACAVWQGCLLGGVLDASLLKAIKPYFLVTAKHDVILGEAARVYCVQLINTVISSQLIFTDRECKQAIAFLSPEGREMIVSELASYLCASQGQDTVNRWDDEAAPFFERVWPREAKYHSPDIARQMKECCDCAGERSEEARELLMPYMQPHT